jgi:hypothetical protein
MNNSDEMIQLLEDSKWRKKKDASFWTNDRYENQSFGIQGTKFFHFGQDNRPVAVGFGVNALKAHLDEFFGTQKKTRKRKAA